MGAFASLGGCAAPVPDTSGTSVRDSVGIEIVENDHTRPMWSAETAWSLAPEPTLRIGRVEGDPTQLLYRVTDSRVLPDGRIAVVNSGSSEVRLYSPSGQYLATIGGPGEGPGEFRSPWHVHPIAGDSLLVIDLYREIAIFDPAGAFVRQFLTVVPEGMGVGQRLEPVDQFADGTLLWRGHYREEPVGNGPVRSRVVMIRTDLNGAFAGSFGNFEDQMWFPRGGREYAFFPWAKEAASDSTMWYGPGDRLELRELAFDGTLQKIVRLDRPPVAVTEADKDAFREGYFAQVQVRGPPSASLLRRVEDAFFPDLQPAHFDIEIDPQGNVWVQDYYSFTFAEPVDRTWTVFNSDGIYMGDVVIPKGLAVHEIGDEYVMGLWTGPPGSRVCAQLPHHQASGLTPQGGAPGLIRRTIASKHEKNREDGWNGPAPHSGRHARLTAPSRLRTQRSAPRVVADWGPGYRAGYRLVVHRRSSGDLRSNAHALPDSTFRYHLLRGL